MGMRAPALAIGSSLAGIGLGTLLGEAGVRPLPAAALLPAVIVSGWLEGAAAGLVSTAIGFVALALSRRPSGASTPELVLFVLNGVLVSFFCHRLRASRDHFADEAVRREELQRQNERLYEEARRANRIKDDFLAVLSHELRTPLNAIVGWTDMMRGGRLAPEMTGRALEIIERSARVSSQLLADMLDVSRIVAGKFAVERAATDLRGIVETAVDTLRWTADDKGVTLLPPPPGADLLVLGDASRLQQVALNLVGNAIKFTPHGGRVRVALRLGADWGELVVEDDGIGIGPELLPHVFERFRQGDSSLTREHRGLGLGLAISRQVVELHEGTIAAYSEGTGRGARFVVRLPLLAARPREEPAPAAANVRLVNIR
jgi:signal transduction histidine kinase